MRYRILTVAAIAAATAGSACGGSTLDPAPSTDLRGGGSTKGNDTTITTNPQTPPQAPPIVSSFNLSGTVYGMDVGTDTTSQSPVPNVGVTLVKVGSVDGDTLNPSVTVAHTTTDAQGAYRLENLAPAYYRIDFTAPAGSPFENRTWGMGPARQTEIKVDIGLERKP